MKICKTQIHPGVVQLTLVEIQLGQVCLSKDKQTEGLDRPAEISSQCWERRGDAPASGWFNPHRSASCSPSLADPSRSESSRGWFRGLCTGFCFRPWVPSQWVSFHTCNNVRTSVTHHRSPGRVQEQDKCGDTSLPYTLPSP